MVETPPVTPVIPPPEKGPTKPEPKPPSILDEVLGDLKKLNPEIDLSFLSVEDQVRAYRQMKPKVSPLPPIVKPDSPTPLNSPPPQEKKIKTFLEKQKDAGFKKNLQSIGSIAHVADKLYQKKE